MIVEAIDIRDDRRVSRYVRIVQRTDQVLIVESYGNVYRLKRVDDVYRNDRFVVSL